MSVLNVNSESSQSAQERLQKRIQPWLLGLLDCLGFREWKNESIQRTLMEALANEENSEPFGDFAFPTGLTLEHNIVSGYFGLQRSQMNVRECGQPLAGMHCKARMKLDRHNITVIARSGATKQSSENKSLDCRAPYLRTVTGIRK